MSNRKQPANETYLAAELAQVMPPSRDAVTAMDLYRIGRAYRRVAERLCGGEEEWGRWSDSVEKAQERARKQQAKREATAQGMVTGLPVKIYCSESSGLMLMCKTKGMMQTALL